MSSAAQLNPPWCNASVYASGSRTGGLQEAINAGCKSIEIPPGYTAVATTTINVNQPNVEIYGHSGWTDGATGSTTAGGSVVAASTMGDLFYVTGQGFKLHNVILQVVTPASRGSNALINAAAFNGNIHDIFVSSNQSSPNNGIFFKDIGSGWKGGTWWIQRVQFSVTMAHWQNALYIANASVAQTLANIEVSDFFPSGQYLDGGIVVDGMIDTFDCQNCIVMGYGATGPAIWIRQAIQNTLPPGWEFPRWIHFVNTKTESPGSTGLRVDAGKNIRYDGYIASGNIGADIGGVELPTNASLVDVEIIGSTFVGLGQQCLIVGQYAPSSTRLIGNQFDDCSANGSGDYDDVLLNSGAGVTLVGNSFRNIAAQPRYNVNVATAFNGLQIVGNDMCAGARAPAVAALNFAASGSSNAVVWGNGSCVPNSMNGVGLDVPASGATNAASYPIQLTSNDSSGTGHNIRFFVDAVGTLHFQYDGGDILTLPKTGGFSGTVMGSTPFCVEGGIVTKASAC